MSILGQKNKCIFISAGLMIFWSGIAFAQNCSHNGAESAVNADHQSMSHSMSMADRPVQNAIIQGRKVSLDVMDMGMHIHMQAMKGNPVPDSYDNKQSRAIMVMIRSIKSKETLKNADVEIQIISPKGKIITGTAPWFGDHYGQSFSPTEKGVYRIIVKVAGKEAKGAADFKYKHEV